MGGWYRLLHFVRPFLPQVHTADTKVPFTLREKVIYTVISLFIFLLFSLLVLPIHSITDADPFDWMRVILSSKRGTLFVLGITPIVTSEMLMIFLVGSNIIQERALFKNLLVILIAFGQAVVYVVSGIYGSEGQLGIGNSMLIIIQLFFVGIIVKCLDELLQKRYRLASGLSLFMATAISENIIWMAFSPITVNAVRGAEFEGSVIALFHLLITKTDKVCALREAFYRQNLPNLASLLATVIIFLIVIYFQGSRLVFPGKSKNARGQQGQQGSYSILPIFLQFNLVFILYSISRLLYGKFSGNFTVSNYVGGNAYYITSPSSLADMAANPLHALLYLMFMLTACALLSKTRRI